MKDFWSFLDGFSKVVCLYALGFSSAMMLCQSLYIQELRLREVDSPTGTIQEFEIELVPRGRITPFPEPALPGGARSTFPHFRWQEPEEDFENSSDARA